MIIYKIGSGWAIAILFSDNFSLCVSLCLCGEKNRQRPGGNRYFIFK